MTPRLLATLVPLWSGQTAILCGRFSMPAVVLGDETVLAPDWEEQHYGLLQNEARAVTIDSGVSCTGWISRRVR